MFRFLFEYFGKEVVMLEVFYLFGVKDMEYWYDVYVLVYVLEGMVQMQFQGGLLVMLKVGDMFYEGLKDVYVVGCNVSDIQFVCFVVVFIKCEGVLVLILMLVYVY